MIYKSIDISQCHDYLVDEDCAKAVIDWRLQTKKGMTQRIFDNAMKQAEECSLYGMEPEEALDRWMESGWTGMKWVLSEAKSELENKNGKDKRGQYLTANEKAAELNKKRRDYQHATNF